MTTPTRWDTVRAKKKGQFGNAGGLPRCRRCGGVSALDPCRSCATPEELALYPPAPEART